VSITAPTGHRLGSYRATVQAMELVLHVQEYVKTNPDFLMSDLVAGTRERFGCSRPTAYRLIRSAVDALKIPYDSLQRLRKREASR
jgi:hypothetical protein